MPYDYNYPDASIDPFAQTAGTDDLFFDDDFTPVAEPVVEANPLDIAPPTEPSTPQQPAPPRGPANDYREGRGGGRGRVRGGRRGGRGGANNESRDKEAVRDKEEDATAGDADDATSENATTSEDTKPKELKTPQAVRGDRSATGGAKRERLTEEELNARIASIKSKNSALTAAHARAEADLANFEAREARAAQQNVERKKLAAEKQKAERQNRQQMMGEREKNRQRKLDALKGREWDNEKEEGFSGTGDERRRGAARGAYGGVAPSSRPEAAALGEDNAPDTPSHRGDRGRGRGRGRGGRGGRGDHGGTPKGEKARAEEQHPPSASDFPDLPPSSAAPSEPSEGPKKLDFPIKGKTAEIKTSEPDRPGVKKQNSFGLPSPAGAGKSWADQVEGS
ncbi:hypothetical protein K469DRAFT_714860 [Zopfia rhizophila CBS 207.26]|uniref:Uncharacterized protein n=1 Tax=Zopfia rhizophila CBS 207.26 TaxID=1314779 RepID=A0A6A6EPZ1_9PEZI|nr:hypothetical protein K469DRAFT_714860 [Zopfia rhizophila CBS 207.26]